ncbi:transmembrane protein [Rhynchospora pubera]|uniref:Transmembrane protein n=1 Tax=Rhynchospora pubera TaxID=906938 RepID=A0AAV8GSH3_9POAL|nr:transmembrane protein [Rhynchospora pubera]
MASAAAVTGGVTLQPLLLPLSSRLNRATPLSSPFARFPSLLSPQFPSIASHASRRTPSPVVAAQFNFAKVVQTAYRIGKDVIETGTNLVPESVPRPVARIGVGFVAVSLTVFLLKSVLSTAFFVLQAMMGVIYFSFVALNSDEGSGGSGNKKMNMSDDDPVEEARRIMEKYK